MSRLRALVPLLMIGLLLLTGQQVTAARASGPGVMQAVLCIGGGLMTVTLDAEGNPVSAPHLCPDAVLAFLPEAAPPRPAPVPLRCHALRDTPPAAPAAATPPRRLPPARGPPVRV